MKSHQYGAFSRRSIGVLIIFAANFQAVSCSSTMTIPASQTQSPVDRFGRLQVKSGQLCDESGQAIQLLGVSSHDLKQYPFAPETVDNLAKDWHVSVVRAAMYTDSYGSSYIHEPQVKEAVETIVQAAIRNHIYVIIDWHILVDGDPNQYRQQAKSFFEEMARKYGTYPNIIYEICNEPNGPQVNWKVVKEYADFIIPAIRAIDPHNIIIVGTPVWSTAVRQAAEDPLRDLNVMYALHFYCGTHKETVRNDAKIALSRGLAIFATEWGLTDYTGKGKLDLSEGQAWVDWMKVNKISWCNWSLSNCDEGSAALKPKATMSGPWTDSELTDSGKWVKSQMNAE